MSPNKGKRLQEDSKDRSGLKQRRSSLAVNLSYTNLTDSGHGSFKKTQSNNSELSINRQLYELSKDDEEMDEMQYFDKSSSRRYTINKGKNISLIDDKVLQDVRVRIVDIKHVRRSDTDYEKLRTAILNKTKQLFNNQDECAIKTNLVLTSNNNSVKNRDECRLFKDKVPSTDALSSTSEKTTHSDKLSIFSTPVKESPNMQKLINSSKITGRKLFKNVDITNHHIIKTVPEANHNLENILPSTSVTNRNHNISPIITGSDNKHCLSKRTFKNISKIARKSTLQDDQHSLSSLSISTDGTGSIGMPILCSTFNEKLNTKNRIQNEESNINNQNLKDMNVNVVSMELTSPEGYTTAKGESTFIKKINATNTNNNKNVVKSNEKSKIEEVKTNTTTKTFQSSQYNLGKNRDTSMSNASEKSMEDALSLNVNTSVDNMGQDKNNSKKSIHKEMTRARATTVRSSLQVNTSLNSSYKRKQSYNKEKESTRISEPHLQHNGKSINEDNDYQSYIECTPYPAPRTVQSKSQLIYNTVRQNIESNHTETIDVSSKTNIQEKDNTVRNLRNKSCLHKRPTTHSIMCTGKKNDIVHNSVIVSDSPVSILDKQQYKEAIIDDTHNGTKLSKEKTMHNSLKNENINSKPHKKKLLPLCDYSVLSISPREELEHLSPKQSSITKKQKKLKRTTKMKKFLKQSLQTQIYPTTSAPEMNDSDTSENNFLTPPKKKKESKRVRKVISKKIVIKKRADSDILKRLENLNTSSDQEAEFESRNSVNEFQTRKEVTQRLLHKSQKIIMVVTGFSNGDKNLIKNIVKTLGMARIEPNVTRRTTHVITTGIRTLNLLYGIIRGCWLLKLEWVLESLENNGWLNPEQYEVAHFSNAVQENRKDRELFGMSYVPELFTTCGFIHIEDGTTPPSHTLKELIKTAGGRITENPQAAKIIIGPNAVKENWILDSITSGDLQPIRQYIKKVV